MASNAQNTVDLDLVLKRYAKAEQRDYQIACIKDTVNLINKHSDVLIDLPTGTGKTLCYSPIVAEIAENGHRSLVLTATKQAQRRVSLEINKFLEKLRTTIIYGVTEYQCPILNGKAENWCCAENINEYCRKSNTQCEVIRSEAQYSGDEIVVTNFSKFLLARGGRKYDIIVLDDSHSFENTKEQAYQITIQGAAARKFYENGITDGRIKTLIEEFLNLFVEIFSRCVTPKDKEGTIPQEYLVRLAKLVTKKDEDRLKQFIRYLSEPYRSVYCSIYYFLKRCRSSSKYRFYVRSDFYEPEDWDSSELISRRDDLVEFVIKKRFGDSRVIYVTATPGDPVAHAGSCTLRDYTRLKLVVTPSDKSAFQDIDNWFRKLNIIVVQDIGDTRQLNLFEKAINLTVQVLSAIPERALVLFKNYRDQRKANDFLSKIFPPEKLFFIDASLQDADFVEELASKSRISLASASSTLWEGINIDKLRLTVIVSPPFIRPCVGKTQTYPHLERRMLIRLQQGIGRTIRGPRDFGVAVLMDGRFVAYVRRKNFSEYLRKRVVVAKSAEVTPLVNEMFKEWSRT